MTITVSWLVNAVTVVLIATCVLSAGGLVVSCLLRRHG